jgi:bifunctional non-homologous end joining protein LigD
MAEADPTEPFPWGVAPMLAKAGELPAPENEGWAYEIKWDGVRALGYAERGRWRMQSRRLEEVTARYPELAAIAGQLADRAAVLDGEVVALDGEGRPSFQLVQRRMGLATPAAIEARSLQTPVHYVVFDLLHLDGRSLRGLGYLERRERLATLGLEGPNWRTPRHRIGGGAELLEAARRQSLEGVVAKRTDSPYRPGRRSGEWIKARVWQRQEFVIAGHIPGAGRRAERVGSLLLGYWDASPAAARRRGSPQRLVFAGAVGSGLREADIELLTSELARRRRDSSPFELGGPKGPKARGAAFCEPELVCEVAWSEWTSDGTLRQPAFKGLRDDKDPRDVVRES